MKKKECEISAVFAIEDKIDEGVCRINDKNNQEQEGRLDSFHSKKTLVAVASRRSSFAFGVSPFRRECCRWGWET